MGHSQAHSNHRTSLVPRLEIALAVIAALRAARRAVAVGLGLVAGAGFLAAGTLHQHAAALAVGNQRALAGRLERLLAARRAAAGGIVVRLTRHWPVEIRPRQFGDLFAELFAQHAGLDLLDLALLEFGQL